MSKVPPNRLTAISHPTVPLWVSERLPLATACPAYTFICRVAKSHLALVSPSTTGSLWPQNQYLLWIQTTFVSSMQLTLCTTLCAMQEYGPQATGWLTQSYYKSFYKGGTVSLEELLYSTCNSSNNNNSSFMFTMLDCCRKKLNFIHSLCCTE